MNGKELAQALHDSIRDYDTVSEVEHMIHR